MYFFFLRMYKMVQIRKKGYEKCQVETINKGRYFWVNRKGLEENLLIGHRFLINVIQKNKNYRHE